MKFSVCVAAYTCLAVRRTGCSSGCLARKTRNLRFFRRTIKLPLGSWSRITSCAHFSKQRVSTSYAGRFLLSCANKKVSCLSVNWLQSVGRVILKTNASITQSYGSIWYGEKTRVRVSFHNEDNMKTLFLWVFHRICNIKDYLYFLMHFVNQFSFHIQSKK